jgi:hypothetical protein
LVHCDRFRPVFRNRRSRCAKATVTFPEITGHVRRNTQRELAQTLLKKQGIMRLVELREAGVTAATMSRMERAGEVIRLSRGVGQGSDDPCAPG